jgi:hypothetical protein
LKLKSLLVITVLALGCSAAFAQAGSYTFGFENYNGSVLYCNYETFTYDGYLAAGFDNLTAACGGAVDADLIGAKTSVPKAEGLGQTGVAVAFADTFYDSYYGFDTQEQWFVLSALKAGAGKHPKQGWIGFAGYDGYILGDNAGILTLSIPGAKGKKATAGPSIGKATLASVKGARASKK